MPARSKDQLGLDEAIVEDAELEALLEERARRKAAASAVRAEYDEVAEKVNGRLIELELDEGPVRIGRWRITKQERPAKTVSFESKASTRYVIADAEEKE